LRSQWPTSKANPTRPVHPSARVFLDNAFEFGFLGDTFVRFIRALDAIQPFVALGWEQLRYFIYAARSGLAAICILDGLADLEPMFAQMALRVGSISYARVAVGFFLSPPRACECYIET
jgi:hypothetical protein